MRKCWLLIIKQNCSHAPIFEVLLLWGNNHQKRSTEITLHWAKNLTPQIEEGPRCTLAFHSSRFGEHLSHFPTFKKVRRGCPVIHTGPWDVGSFQTAPCLGRTEAWELPRQGSHKGTFWSLDPYYAAGPSAETWVDRVSPWMKGLLLIPWSSDDGKRSHGRGGIWFPLQISKLKTNYPHDLKWWQQKPRIYFHPKLILSFVCGVKLEYKIRVNDRKGFQTFFFKFPLSCWRQRQRLKTEYDGAWTPTALPWAWQHLLTVL